MGRHLLEVDNATVRYGALSALDALSWHVDSGEILGIIGPNGAGKSSCFAAATNSVPHTGRVLLNGKLISGLPSHEIARRGLRRSFQQNSFFAELTVLQNAVGTLAQSRQSPFAQALFLPWRDRARRHDAEAAAAKSLEAFGVGAKYHHQRPAEIPYGVQRLLSIALSHGEQPCVLLLDEPGAGIGGQDMAHLAQLLSRLRDTGLAVVVIEHHMDLIMSVSDRIMVIESGRLLAEGTPEQVRADPRVLEAYLGHGS